MGRAGDDVLFVCNRDMLKVWYGCDDSRSNGAAMTEPTVEEARQLHENAIKMYTRAKVPYAEVKRTGDNLIAAVRAEQPPCQNHPNREALGAWCDECMADIIGKEMAERQGRKWMCDQDPHGAIPCEYCRPVEAEQPRVCTHFNDPCKKHRKVTHIVAGVPTDYDCFGCYMEAVRRNAVEQPHDGTEDCQDACTRHKTCREIEQPQVGHVCRCPRCDSPWPDYHADVEPGRHCPNVFHQQCASCFRRVGHAANCRCCAIPQGKYPEIACVRCCGAWKSAHPYTDPRCKPGLLMLAEAKWEERREAWMIAQPRDVASLLNLQTRERKARAKAEALKGQSDAGK